MLNTPETDQDESSEEDDMLNELDRIDSHRG
jgi:hypothetical protein